MGHRLVTWLQANGNSKPGAPVATVLAGID
jgi:hypothetical protein